MSQTLTNLLYHIVFSTKGRENLITDELRKDLYPYIGGIVKGEKGTPICVGGMMDHVHLLIKFSPTINFSQIVQKIKGGSSKWIHEKQNNRLFSWQGGYGAFSVSESNIDIVRQYIESQREHHKRLTFKEEYELLLKKHNIVFNEQYLWD